jgi:hypothetical protein
MLDKLFVGVIDVCLDGSDEFANLVAEADLASELQLGG